MDAKNNVKNKYLPLILGLLAVLVGNIPFYLLRNGVVFPLRDQLDGEIVAYILGGNHLFDGTSFYPEYMGGVSTTALVPPSNLSVLFFAVMSPLYAFLANNLFMMVFAFLGMYLWGSRIGANRWIAAAVAVLFAFLPFYPVYGLSKAGVPLVAWAFTVLADQKAGRKERAWAYLSIVLFGAASSLVLSGYAVLVTLGIIFLYLLIAKKSVAKSERLRFLSGIILLTAVYCIENYQLILQIFGAGEAYVSNKSEYVIASSPFLERFKEVLIHGILVVDMHWMILIEILVVGILFVALTLTGRKSEAEAKQHLTHLLILSCAGLLIALFSAIYRSEAVVSVLNQMSGSMKAFQADRFFWMLPFIWYSCLVALLSYLTRVIRKQWLAAAAVVLFLAPCAFVVLKGSTFKENAMELVRTNSTALTWEGFFCEDQFAEVAAFIKDTEGKDQSQYRVGCLGIEPAAAIYSGFYTIDGYSNNYDVEYKHRFRKVIARELEKNDYNRTYFDDWGNRCYLFASEYYGNAFLSKYAYPHFDDLQLDTEALKELDCSYLLAAGEIAGAEEKGLELLKVFDRSDWTYYIYLYQVK